MYTVIKEKNWFIHMRRGGGLFLTISMSTNTALYYNII